MGKSVAKYVLPLPIGGALGWAAGATSGGTLPASWTWTAMAAWSTMPANWAPMLVAFSTGIATYYGLRGWLDGDPSADRDELTHRLLTGDIVARVETAIDAGALDAEQRQKLADKLTQTVLDSSDASPEQAARFAETTLDLAQSESAADRRIADQVIGGRPEQAADDLIVEARAGKQRNAARFRQAARLYAPFAPSKAMDAYREAVDLDPGDLWSWIELGRLRRHYGSLADARNCFASALQRIRHERDRMVLYNEFGNLLVDEGEPVEALKEYRAGLAIAEKLATAEVDNLEWQRDLTVSHNKIGDVERVLQNLPEARERYESALAIREKLAAADLHDPQLQRDLWASYNKLGDLERALGNLGAARQRCEAGLRIVNHLIELDPGNRNWQRDLSISYERLGDIETVDANYAAALDHYKSSLAISQILSTEEPNNFQWKRDLAVSHNKVGDAEIHLGCIETGQKHYKAGSAISQELADLEPSNSEWQRDVFVSQSKMGALALLRGDRLDALSWFRRADEVMSTLVASFPDHPGFAQELALIREMIAKHG